MPKMGSINGGESARELIETQAQVWNCSFNYMKSMSLKCAIQLGIPDIIHKHGQPMTLSQIISALNIQPRKANGMQRLLRILVQSGFFAQQKVGESEAEQEEAYVLTPTSRLLLKDGAIMVGPFAVLVIDPILTTPLHLMSDWFLNDQPTVFETAHGKNFWEFVADEPKFKNVFHDNMITDSRLVARILLGEYEEVFKGLKSLVDVGGCRGTLAEAIAQAYPDMKCTVLDLPHVVDGLKGTNNLEFLGGDMFESVPPADAVLLKWILHDWGDEESLQILKRCKEAIPSKDKGGKLIIIEMVIGHLNQDKESIQTQLSCDMLMMSLFTVAKERTEKEWEKLFLQAGFTHYKITPILGLRSVIEVYP